MPRRSSVNIIREVGVDPKYKRESIQKFINVVMWRGKKDTARRLVYGAFDIIAKRMGEEKVVSIFDKAVENTTPLMEVRGRRVGGSVYQVPMEVEARRGRAISFRNIVKAAGDRVGSSFSIRLAAELLEAYDLKGGAVKAKLDKHRMAESNRAFSHLSW